MGILISLDEHRTGRGSARRRHPAAGPAGTTLAGLDLALRRLAPLVREATAASPDPGLETELLAAIGAVTTGLHADALRRVEALRVRLEGRPSDPADERPRPKRSSEARSPR